MKKSSIDSQEEARARLKEKMENKRRKQSKSLSKNSKDNDEKSGCYYWFIFIARAVR